MKKILMILAIALLLVLSCIWLLIPQKIKISSAVTYTVNSQSVFRFLTTDTNWKKWWPDKTTEEPGSKMSLSFSGYDFHIEKILYQVFELNFTKNKDTFPAIMKIIGLDTDSTGIEFSSEIDAGMNPVKRITGYFDAKKIKEAFDSILISLVSYTKELKNIYGFEIHKEKVQMQYLLSASNELDHYPSTQDIYSLVEKMRAYLSTTDGKEEYSPMLNIETNDNLNYLVRVGVPINKNLPGTNGITVKQMVKNSNILMAEVTGGVKTIEHALKQMEIYISDYQRSIIALPFQSLETDRLKVTDSTKWVTKIFYPVV